MKVSLIAAASENDVIGYRRSIPWHLPEDLKRFKRLTMGHCVVMGRKTFESIGRPLPGRKIIVLTRQEDWQARGVWRKTGDPLEALRWAEEDGENELFVAGGQEVYQRFAGLAGTLYLTRVHIRVEGDRFFPLSLEAWKLLKKEEYPDTSPPHTFHIYARRPDSLDGLQGRSPG